MGNTIKVKTYGTLSSNTFFDRKVSISFDTTQFDPTADFKVLVQIEPTPILNIVNEIIKHSNNFDLILSWHPKVLGDCKNSVLFPFGSCWINEDSMSIHDKNKLVSIIASTKRKTIGHILRHQIIKDSVIPMDVFGRGYKLIDNKISGLKDYMFSLIIENDDTDNWFTEKLIDCLVTGTVPIFWGCNNIDNYFNTEGFIKFDTIEEFNLIAPTLTKDKYIEMLPFINENFKLSLNYIKFHERVETVIKNELT